MFRANNNDSYSRFSEQPHTNSHTSNTASGSHEPGLPTTGSVADDNYTVEEAHEDCVYLVTIKKVYNKNYTPGSSVVGRPQSQPITTSNPYGSYKPLENEFRSYVTENENANNSNNLVYKRVKIKQLKYASLDKFIELLCNRETGSLDSNLVQTFLATYRTFTDAPTVLTKMRKRYESIAPASLEMTEDVRVENLRSIRTILYMWLDNYSEDFNEPPDYPNLNELNKFAQLCLCTNGEYAGLLDTIAASASASSNDLSELIKRKFDQFENLNSSSSSPHASFIINKPSAIKSAKTTLSDQIVDDLQATKLASEGGAIHRRTNSSCTNLAKLNGELKSSMNNSNQYSSTSQLNNAITSLAVGTTGLLSTSSTGLNQINGDLADIRFMSIDSNYFAEQLTYLDKCLFQNVLAYNCLGSVWGTRYQKGKNSTNILPTNGGAVSSTSLSSMTQSTASQSPNSSSTSATALTTPMLKDKFASIGAFIDQFNRVSYFVQATVLEQVNLKPIKRAHIIQKWIEIAQACRRCKNFSSLNAIVQGLNTQCISRLQKTWALVSRLALIIVKN
jgi:ral guanine nucleotide dissociation stimulator